MNKKLLYVLILIFLAAVIIFNIFLKQPPSFYKTGMNPAVRLSGVAA